jgi:hypothetical protein
VTGKVSKATPAGWAGDQHSPAHDALDGAITAAISAIPNFGRLGITAVSPEATGPDRSGASVPMAVASAGTDYTPEVQALQRGGRSWYTEESRARLLRGLYGDLNAGEWSHNVDGQR